MDRIQSDEGLRVWMINYLAETLGEHAILKGGMVLRLLDCPRYTNDLDYVFIPFRSKKSVLELVSRTLKKIEGLELNHQLHSTNACFEVRVKNQFGFFKTQIEISTADFCESQALSTGDFALQFNQIPHVVRVMRFDVALAHKLAAWNERQIIRDLYDAAFMYKNLGELPNLQVLEKRLETVSYAKNLAKKSLPTKMTLEGFFIFLERELERLEDQAVLEQLRDFIDSKQLPGLARKIRVGLMQMIEKVRDDFLKPV